MLTSLSVVRGGVSSSESSEAGGEDAFASHIDAKVD